MDGLTVGSTLGSYRIDGVLGQGGMATVYRGVELGPLERVVALKVMSPALSGNDEYRTRFLHEARTAAGLHHPNLVPIYEFKDDGGRLYLAMQYVEGTDLASHIRQAGALDLADLVTIGSQVGDALDFAHYRGVIHRDVKPANVMLEASHRSGAWRAMLADFGISTVRDEPRLTRPGTILGSLPYAAPEVIKGDVVTGAADLYSFGCMLFEMLTGRAVFVRENHAALIHAHVSGPIPAVSDMRPELSTDLDGIFAKALAKEPSDRWGSCADLVEALATSAARSASGKVGVASVGGQVGEVGTPSVVAPATRAVFPPRLGVESPFAFVGRSDEHRQLEDAWKHVVAGGRRTVLVSGEPGVGKTTLVGSFARDRHDADALVLYGRCDEDLGIPYQPWVEVFGFLAEHLREALVRVAGDRLGELGPFLHDLVDVEPAGEGDAEFERFSLFATAVNVLNELGSTSPLVLVLDDLQWADRPTLLLLRHLLTAAAGGRFLVLGTFRDSEVDDRHPLADLLAAAHRDEEISRLSLRGLEDNDLIELLTSAAGHELPEEGVALAHTLRRETNGNPFFAIEILRHLAETGVIARNDAGRWQSQEALVERGLPVSVREVVGRRVARLGEEVERILRAASVIGREFDLALLADVVELSDEATIDLLDAAVAADLVQDLAPETFGFVHALVEHALCDGLSPTRRARLHRRVAEAIEGLAPGTRLAELAYHWSEATLPQDQAKAIDSARRAGDHALAALAPEEARRWYAHALELIDRDRDPATTCDLTIGLAEAQRQVGDPEYRTTFFAAAALAEALGDADRLVHAALGNGRNSGFSAFGDVDHERLQLLRRALDVVDPADRGRRARLFARLAAELTFADAGDERDTTAAEAMALAREAGDDRTLLAVLLIRGDTILSPAFVEERRQVGSEALVLAERHGDQVAVFLACEVLFDTACATGDLALADEMLARLMEIDGRIGQPELRWPARWRQAERAILAGDLERAERLSVEGFEIGNDAGQPDALMFHLGQLFIIRYMQGRLHEHIDLFDQLALELTPVPIQDALYAVASLAADRFVDGARLLAESRQRLPQLRLDEQWTCTMTMWARVACAVGDDAAAAVLLELLLPWRHLFALNGVAVSGPIGLYAGLLAHRLGRDDADLLLRDAVLAADRVGDPYHGAEGRLALADRSLDDPVTAQALLRDAGGLIEGRSFVVLDAELRRLTDLLDHRPGEAITSF